MRKILLIILVVILFFLILLFLQSGHKKQILAKRINTNIEQIGKFDSLVIACDKEQISAIRLFEKEYISKYNIKKESSIEKLSNLYAGKNSYVFILSKKQIEELRKIFPRMSLIEMKEKLVFHKEQVFFITKNKCNCGK